MNSSPFENLNLTDKERIDLLKNVLDSSLDAVISINSSSIILEWSRAAEDLFLFSKKEALGKKLDELIIPSDLVSAHRLGMKKYITSGEHKVLNKRIEIEAIDKKKDRFLVELAISPVFFRDEVFFTARIRKIDDRKRYERQLILISKELAHREKNSLAVVSSIFRQIAHYAKNIEDFKKAFDSWIVSYSKTHELLSMDQDNGMSLLERVKIEFSPYNTGNNIFISGDDIYMKRHSALNFGICLHETVINSVKHGALSSVNGKIEFKSVIDDKEINMYWKESGGPIISPPTKFGFGSRLIKYSLMEGLKGSCDYQFPPTGFFGRVTIPLSSIND